MKKRTPLLLPAVLLGFLLGVQNGRIALWKDGNAEPLRVFPYLARMLPEADQAALNRGIPVETEQELVRLLEDYLS